MKRMINKLVYSYSSSESLLLSEQSHFYMDKAKQTKKAYDWVKLQTPGFLNIARLRPFASGYPWNKRSFSSMCAGTGIQDGLRSRWMNIRVGSTPITSTNIGRYPVIGSGADCKSAGLAVSGGSSPSLPTKK